jgi:hypothetical protein
MSGEIVQLSVAMRPTGALQQLRRDLDTESRAPAPMLDVPLVGQGRLEIRMREVQKDLLLPPHLKWHWAVMEVYATDNKVVHEEIKVTGLKATPSEALAEAELAFTALSIERGAAH